MKLQLFPAPLVIAILAVTVPANAPANSCSPTTPIPLVSVVFTTKESTATLCGISEYTAPSIEPKKYRLQTLSGLHTYINGCNNTFPDPPIYVTGSGTLRYNPSNCNPTNSQNQNFHNSGTGFDSNGQVTDTLFPTYGSSDHAVITKTPTQFTIDGDGFCQPDHFRVTGRVQFSLSEEDTEADAENRATATTSTSSVLPSRAAYRTSRVGSFSFDFRSVKYAATFNLKCPGDYNFLVRYTTKSHNSTGPGTPHVQVVTRRCESGMQTISGAVNPSQKDVDYTIEGIEARLIPSCGGAAAGTGSFTIGSIRAWLSLGAGAAGYSSGGIMLETETMSSALYTPSALVDAVPDTGEVIVVRDSGGALRQIKAPQAFADIVVLSSSAYEVRFYLPADVGTPDPVTKIYALNSGATPFVVHKFEDSSNSETSGLRITETRGAATAKISEYGYTASDGSWSLSTGGGLRKETAVTTVISTSPPINKKTLTVQNNANQVVSKIARTYQTFAWGEELIKEVLDPDGAALTTDYIFYNDANDALNYKHLKQRTDANGNWEFFTYDSSGRTLKSIRPFLNGGPLGTTDSNETLAELEARSRVTAYTYDTVSDADGDDVPEARTKTVERIKNTDIACRYRIDYSKTVTLGSDVCNSRRDIVCVAANAAWDATDNLVTKTLTISSDTFAGRTRRIINPDGTGSLVSYSLASNNVLTTTAKAGQLNTALDDVIDGRRTVTTTNAQGQVTGETVVAIIDATTTLELSSWTAAAADIDAMGRPTKLTYSDGTYVLRGYACCGFESERDRTGMVTNYTYDALGRQETVTRALAPSLTGTPEAITMKTVYDADGRVKTVTRIGGTGADLTEMVRETNTYDLAGRLIQRKDARDRATGYAETFSSTGTTAGQTTRTTTNPDGGTVVEVFVRDGSRVSVDGTVAAPHTFAYDVNTTGVYTKDTAKGLDDNNQPTTTEWTISYTDFAGRPLKTVFPDSSGFESGTSPVAQSFYNAAGQLSQQVDPDGVTTLFGYNLRGEQDTVAIDMNHNGMIDEGGDNGIDRVTKTVSTVATNTDGGGYTVLRTTTSVLETDNSTTATPVTVSDQSTDGRRTWQTVRGSSLSTKTVTELDAPSAGLRRVTTTTPDSVQTVQIYSGDRLLSTTVKDTNGAQLTSVSYEYDKHGRLSKTIDARNDATTTMTYYADDQVYTVTTPDPDTTRSGGGYDPQVTTYEYDAAGRQNKVKYHDGGMVNTTYYLTGAIKRVSGSRTSPAASTYRTYPVEYTYDLQGRMKTLTTWRNFAGDADKAVTTWNYYADRGFLKNKRYADNTGPSYTYKASGRLLTRTWARSPAITTTYSYNSAGDLETTDYSDSTPDVTITYNRDGRPKTIADGSGSRTLSYHASGPLQSETYTAGLLNGLAVSRTYDLDPSDPQYPLKRLYGVSLAPSSLGYDVKYGYDGASGRFKTVKIGSGTNAPAITYAYLADSDLVETVTFDGAGATRLTTTKNYDALSRLTKITNHPSASGTSDLTYTYEYNNANQRTRATREDNAYWSYDYDSLGQVTSSKKYNSSNAATPGHDFAWTFDDIGNRKTSTINGASATYTPNSLNQYTDRTVPGVVDVLGAASSSATVTVGVNNGTPQATTRQGELFYKQVAVNNSSAAQNASVKITGVKNLVGPNQEDAVTEVTKTAFVAKTPETFTPDADGNLTDDARWKYTWDGENRLIAVETSAGAAAAGVTKQRLEFAYDGQSRRVSKKVYAWNGSAFQLSTHTLFLYDGWNLLAELNALNSNAAIRTYVWGLDLSGTSQGAGGVGGLLAITDAGTSTPHFTAFDGNGNVGGLINAASGLYSAKYDYNAFGEPVAIEGAFAANNPFRFSSKFTDAETGHLYYGFRCYAPETGRWLSRDPSEEDGGLSLYVYVNNAPTDSIDVLGLDGLPTFLLSKQKAYEIAKGRTSGDFAHSLLRHYIWGDRRTLTLGRDAVLNKLKPRASLLTSDLFRNDIASSSFNGTKQYAILTFDFNNPSGGLGNYTVVAKVTVCASRGSWTAQGVATIMDRWDFDWTWSNLYRAWQRKLSTGQVNLGGRETRTALGSLIPGDPFDVRSVEVPVRQSSGDSELIFGP